MKPFNVMPIAIAVLILALSIPVDGQSGGPYELSWNSIDGGGGMSSGGPYTLRGVVGQPDAAYSRGGDYEVFGGYLPGGPICTVAFDDFARFVGHWLETPCGLANEWCGGADWNQFGDVDFGDLDWFLNYWLYDCPGDWPFK